MISHEITEFEFHISLVRSTPAAPDARRHLRHELQQTSRAVGIVAEPVGTLDRLGHVGNDPVAPTPQLVANGRNKPAARAPV